MKPTRTLPIAIYFFTLINSFLARWESNREQEVLQNSGKRIIPGAEWKDTDGNLIQAHGAGIIKVKDTWYWFGEDKTKNNHAFLGISCYSSRDLASWKRHPNVLQVSEDDNSALNKNQVIERPKVIYNAKTKKYVMYFHYDSSNYGLAQVGVATSTRVDRDWKFIKAFSPLNSQSRDMSLYQDDDPDKTAYISFASDGNANLKIAKLSEDYLDVVELVYKWDRVFWEATGIVKNNGIYTMLYSKQDGWNPNPNSAMQAYNISGPWQAPTLIAPQNVKTYSSQNTYDFTVKGSEITSFIYAGDRWFPKSLGESTYIWLPLLIQGTKISLIWADIWSINSKTGKKNNVKD
ncbi:glycosyl hydrolase family 43 protein [Phakopsora pachyrhizi]|uniref:Glycosyl hydrolase family 43 protein n=1 Tax=Phakopsora pachyrhizi TaxID=170000 RepID=A0AAV0BL52_PHAPC|nr:glycosyl hydrolase family 43 protein [Phakopsora pachyrhizi]